MILQAVYVKEIDHYVKANERQRKGKIFAMRMILGQCSASMTSILLSRERYKASRTDGDDMAVLDHVKTACYDFYVVGMQ